MTDAEVKHVEKPQAKYKAPPPPVEARPDLLSDHPAAARAEPVLPKPRYQPMENARKDGRPLFLTDGKIEVEAVWRISREFVPPSDRDLGKPGIVGQWKHVGRWAIYNAGGQKVPWEPTGWRRP